jgi:hypothetical protein
MENLLQLKLQYVFDLFTSRVHSQETYLIFFPFHMDDRSES